ncbi:amidohydrolase family protein [Petrimonas sp.]|uniref:amidohydrolase family protein n=1 Tax=Petrimonas sp. TaxID=2023866 RepID=UPI003FA79616
MQASKLANHHPAQALGLGHRKGLLREDYDADFVMLYENLDVLQPRINSKWLIC